MIPTYDKEAWYQECLKDKPDMSREEFEARWQHVWMIANLMGIVRRTEG